MDAMFVIWFYVTQGLIFLICTTYIILTSILIFLRIMVTIRWCLRAQPKETFNSEGVSIIKPLFGDDPHLKTNLESFFQLHYPKFELLLCVGEKENGASLQYIEELRNKYPQIDAQIFEGGRDVGPNPKICNMIPAYDHCKYSFIWLSDSSIYTLPDNLNEMMDHMSSEKVALVHQLPFVKQANYFHEYVNMVYFGTQYARMCLMGNFLNLSCANGMSFLLRKTALEDIGGLEQFSDYLAEDYFIPKALMKRGLNIALSTKKAMQNRGGHSTATYQERATRWTALRLAMVPHLTLVEPLSECFASVLIGIGVALSIGFSHKSIAVFFAAFVLLWILLDAALLCAITDGSVGNPWLICTAWLYREVSTYWCFLCGLFSKEVIWGGKRYKLQWWGKAETIFNPETE